MIKVQYVPHPLADYLSRKVNLEVELNKIEEERGTILYITSDNGGYTIVYRENNKLHS